MNLLPKSNAYQKGLIEQEKFSRHADTLGVFIWKNLVSQSVPSRMC